MLIMITTILTGCSNHVKVKIPTKNDSAFITNKQSTTFESQGQLLTHFVTNKMVKHGGIYTNYRTYTHTKGIATGHEMLSESSKNLEAFIN